MFSFNILCIFMLLYVSLSVEMKQRTPTLKFQIRENELNRVIDALLNEVPKYTTEIKPSTVRGQFADTDYEFTSSSQTLSSSTNPVTFDLSVSGSIIIQTKIDSLNLTGTIKVTTSNGKNKIYDGDITLMLANLTITSIMLENSDHFDVVTSDRVHFTILQTDKCSAEFSILSESPDFLQNTTMYLTTDNRRSVINQMICSLYDFKVPLGFGTSDIHFHILGHTLSVKSVSSGWACVNSSLVINEQVQSARTDGNFEFQENLSNNKSLLNGPNPTLTSLYNEPFSIVIHIDAINEILYDLRIALGIGIAPVSLSEALPILPEKYTKLAHDDVAMYVLFPQYPKVFPKSTGDLLLKDANMYLSVDDGIWMVHIDVSGELVATLWCNNRTESALNFTMNMAFPAQIGYDNKYLTMRVTGLRGNITFLNSNIGHIVDRSFRTLVYSLPYYVSDQLSKMNDQFSGIPIEDILPNGIFMDIRTIGIVQEEIIIVGTLLTKRPELKRLAKEKIQWHGRKLSQEKMFVMSYDHTPEDLEPLPEQNCEEPTTVPPYTSGAAAPEGHILALLKVFIESAIRNFR